MKIKIFLIFLIVSVSILSGCEKSFPKEGISACLENKINEFKDIACDKGATVKEYTFQGETVYKLYPGNCGADMTSAVIDSGCNSLGDLGGILGNTKINGEEFSKAIYVKTIWDN